MKNKTKENILIALAKGYMCDKEGNIYGASGKKLKVVICEKKFSRYYLFNVLDKNGKRCKVYYHRFIAYILYGDKSFKKEPYVIRHDDGNTLNNRMDNIVMGTRRDRMMKMTPEERRLQARRQNKKYTDEFIMILRKEWDEGLSYNKLSEKHQVPKSMLSYYLSSTAKSRSMVI